MLVWAIYDISKNKLRNYVVKACKKAGLYRVQKSVFVGNVDKNTLDELKIKSERIIDKETDSVYIFQMCEEDYKKVILLGQAFDKKFVADQVLTVIL